MTNREKYLTLNCNATYGEKYIKRSSHVQTNGLFKRAVVSDEREIMCCQIISNIK